MNEHTRERESKCRQCKKEFIICQTNSHGPRGDRHGWRICYIPCFCGPKYYPDKAKSAHPLADDEYATSHPGYRATEAVDTTEETTEQDLSAQNETHTSHGRSLSQDSDDPLQESLLSGFSSLTVGNHASSSRTVAYGHGRTLSQESEDPLRGPSDLSSHSKKDTEDELPAGEPLYVQADWKADDQISFKHPLSKRKISTSPSDWTEGTVQYEGVETPCWMFWDGTQGCTLFTWEFGDKRAQKGKKRK
jgi:hypothetical protein